MKKNNFFASEYFIADSETDPFKFGRVPKPFLWGVMNDRGEHKFFTRTNAAVNFIQQFEGAVYAHNGGKFDWLFLEKYIEPWMKILRIRERIAVLNFGNCNLRDSYLIYPMPLASNEKMKFNYKWMEKGKREKKMKLIKKYLVGDLESLRKIVAKFRGEFGDKWTLASAAMAQAKEILGPEFEKGFLRDALHDAWLRKFYFGGRTQCFQKGVFKKPRSYDRNSAYPEAMTHLIPMGIPYDYSGRSPITEKSFLKIKCKTFSKGLFPSKVGGTLDFPNSSGEYFITGAEYLVALKYIAKSEMKILERTECMQSISFRPYVDHFWAKKEECEKTKDKLGRQFAKLMLNSLYGKMGSAPMGYLDEELIPTEYLQAAADEGYAPVRPISEKIMLCARPKVDTENSLFHVGAAACITGISRAALNDAIQKCGKRMLYCDTDNVVIENGTIPKIPIGKKLGQWKPEKELAMGYFYSKKLYALKYAKPDKDYPASDPRRWWKWASKGIRCHPEDIVNLVKNGKTIHWQSEAPSMRLGAKPTFVKRSITANNIDE